MFNIGGGEILVIMLVALVVLGPDKLPQAMRTVGSMVAEVRKLSTGFQSEMRNAMYDERPTYPGSTEGTPGSGADKSEPARGQLPPSDPRPTE